MYAMLSDMVRWIFSAGRRQVLAAAGASFRPTNQRYALWLSSALLLLLAACGGNSVESESTTLEEIGSVQQAAGGVCSTQDIAWPTGASLASQVCAGPIEYALKCYAEMSSNACTPTGSYTQKTCYPECRHPVFGVESVKSFSGTATVQPILVSSTTECQYNPDVLRVECEVINVYNYNTPCVNAAIAKANTWPSPWNYTAGFIKVFSYSAPNNDGASSTCSYTLTSVPNMYSLGRGPECGAGYSCNDKPIYNVCRAPSHGLVSPTLNQCGPSLRYTAPGKSMAQARADAQAAWQARQTYVQTPDVLDASDFTEQLTCLTCESLPLTIQGSDAEANAKYTCLDARLNGVLSLPSGSAPGGVDRAALEATTVAELKLLFEMKGHQLSTVQQDRMRALYSNYPTAKLDCGASFQAPPVNVNTCPYQNFANLNAELDLCKRLTASHVPAASAFVSIQLCTGLVEDIASLASVPSCEFDAYREAYRAIWLGLFERTVSSLKRDATLRPNLAELQTRLGAISSWYALTSEFLYYSDPNDPVLTKNLSDVFSVLWKGLYQGGLLDSSSAQLNSNVGDPFNTGLQTDASVLLAALQPISGTSQLPLQGPPLLMLLGDGMRGLHDRLDDFSRLHDLGCRFKGCAAGTVKTEVSELWALVGAMADATALQTAVNNASHLAAAPQRRQEWRTIFSLLQQQHAAFESAVKITTGATSYSPALLMQEQATPLPESAVASAGLARDGLARTQSYQASGVFLSTAHNTLRMGIQETKQAMLNGQILLRKQDLQNAITDYQANRLAYVGARVQEMNNTQSQTTLVSQVEQKFAQFGQLAEDLVGLRVNAAVEDAAFADFAQSFNTQLDAEAADLARLQITRGPPYLLSLSAANARFIPGSNADNILSFAVRSNGTTVWKLDGNPGEVLNVNVQGLWTPSCALRSASFLNPSGGSVTLGGYPPLTGPAGYLVTSQNDVLHAESNTSSRYASDSTADKACAGISAAYTIGGFFAEVWGVSVTAYASAESCMVSETGTRASTDQMDSWQQRASAAYSTGIRVKDTPFPHLPAGSLLLVEVLKGSTSRGAIRDVHVLQPSSNSFIIGATPGQPNNVPDPGVDLYLVVNDSATCTPDVSQSLSVSAQRLVPAGTAAVAVGKAMAKTLTSLRDATDLYVAQGRVLPQDLAAKRDAAIAQLHLECAQCDLAQFPPSLMALYNAFVSKELARMERKVEIRSVERAMSLMLMELKIMADDLESATAQGRILRLVPAWSLRNLDGERLRDASSGVSVLVTDYLFPVIDIRYPALLSTLKTELKLTVLVTADWTDSFVNLSNLALDAVSAIQTKLGETRTNTPDPFTKKVALSFPRPGASAASLNNSLWRKVSGERAAAVWSSLLPADPTLPLKFTVQITPDDLYAATGGTVGALQCTEATPVLHRLALYWVRSGAAALNNSAFNGLSLNSATEFGSALAFPSADGIKTYYMQNPLWLVGQSRELFGLTTDAFTTFQTQELNLPENQQVATGDGLSPFSTITFDVTGMRSLPGNPLATVDELVVLMELDRLTATGMPEPLVCQ